MQDETGSILAPHDALPSPSSYLGPILNYIETFNFYNFGSCPIFFLRSGAATGAQGTQAINAIASQSASAAKSAGLPVLQANQDPFSKLPA